MPFIINWLLATIAVILAAYLLPGVQVSGWLAALAVAVVLGLINAFIRPVLVLLTLPINILTLGLFTIVINAVLILLTSKIVPGFAVSGFWWAALFSIVLFLINAVLGVRRP